MRKNAKKYVTKKWKWNNITKKETIEETNYGNTIIVLSILFQYIFSWILSMNKIRFRYSCFNVSDETEGVEVGVWDGDYYG